MAIRSLAELIMLRRADEQSAAVLLPKWCFCGMPVKRGSQETRCPRCRMNIKRRRKRELYGRTDRK